MKNMRIFLTGASGGMGSSVLRELVKEDICSEIIILSLDTKKDRKILAPFMKLDFIQIFWGDLTKYEHVLKCVEGSHMVLHIGALVSPLADYHPELAMKVNWGSTINIIRAIRECGQTETTKLVFIGTIAETGDRLPPIHWGRVGDPIKPSIFDYYAVSKIAAERAVIESGLKYWVSLRQTGMLSRNMCRIKDSIIFHNCLDNVLEYVSDRDSGVLIRNLCRGVPEVFWNHIYNIGGGESCRISTTELYRELFKRIGIEDLYSVFDSKWFATRNFHGQYYLDSDKLEEFLHFRRDSIDYFYEIYMRELGFIGHLSKFLSKLPSGLDLIAKSMKKQFVPLTKGEHGTLQFFEQNKTDHIASYFLSREEWEKIPPMNEIKHFTDWDRVVHIDHGYDECKPESELDLIDVRQAVEFRGGKCNSNSMDKGDWTGMLQFTCAFGHLFEASPRLILQGGHWCPICERESWNYHKIAESNPFFAQVWYPLHHRDEKPRVYKKIVSDLDLC